MPRLTPDNLMYLARGARRLLYGPLCDDPPSCREEAMARNAEQVGGQVLIFVFGPAHMGGFNGDHYRQFFSAAVIDYYAPPLFRNPERIHTIESSFEQELQQHPFPCDVIVCLFKRARPTYRGATLAAYREDPEYRACIDRDRRERPTD